MPHPVYQYKHLKRQNLSTKFSNIGRYLIGIICFISIDKYKHFNLIFGLSCDNTITMQVILWRICDIQTDFLPYMCTGITKIPTKQSPWFILHWTVLPLLHRSLLCFFKGIYHCCCGCCYYFVIVCKYVGSSDIKPQNIIQIKNLSKFLF